MTIIIIFVSKRVHYNKSRSFILLTPQSGSSIGHFNRKNVGTIHDIFSFTSGNIVSDFCCVSSLQHEQSVDIFDIMNYELTESIGTHMSCLRITPVPNTGHKILSFESPANTTVDTFGFSPTLSHTITSFGLRSNELLSSFLDNVTFCAGNHHGEFLVLCSLNISD